MKQNNFRYFVLMHFGFLLYSFYTVIGKFASTENFLSIKYCFFYALVLSVLFVYAVIWQQVLKHILLSTAVIHKSATIIWGIVWSVLFFNDTIQPKMIAGAFIIVVGLAVLSTEKNQ